ncbi:MAG: hypothetical protein LBF25_02500 [Puniceicoccales bacterium]|jgi:hypothetical protein|nr:hypothetical protein [Puniceicoccales bacterium]
MRAATVHGKPATTSGSTDKRSLDVQATRWVMRAGETGLGEFSLGTRAVSAATKLSWLAQSLGTKGPSRLAYALKHVRRSMDPRICVDAMGKFSQVLKGSASNLHTGTTTGTIAEATGISVDKQNSKLFRYKSLQICIINGPNDLLEMSISFPGTTDQVADADAELEAFVGALKSLGTVETDDAGRRTLTIDGIVIGLPLENCFSQGVRFKILREGDNKRALLDNEAVEALHVAMKSEGIEPTAAHWHGDTIQSLLVKCEAYRTFREKTDGSELSFEEIREAALTKSGLKFVINLLEKEKKSGHSGGFNHAGPVDPGISSAFSRSASADSITSAEVLRQEMYELRTQLKAVLDENATLQSQLKTAQAELGAAAERLRRQENDFARQVDEAARRHGEELDALQRERDIARTENATLRERITALEADATATAQRHETEFEGRTNENRRLTRENARLAEANHTLTRQNATLGNELDALQKERNIARTENATLRTEHEAALGAAQGENERLTMQVTDLEGQLGALRTDNADLRRQLEAAQAEIKRQFAEFKKMVSDDIQAFRIAAEDRELINGILRRINEASSVEKVSEEYREANRLRDIFHIFLEAAKTLVRESSLPEGIKGAMQEKIKNTDSSKALREIRNEALACISIVVEIEENLEGGDLPEKIKGAMQERLEKASTRTALEGIRDEVRAQQGR